MQDHTSGTANKQVTLTGGVVLRPGSAALLRQNQLLKRCSVDGPLAANCLRKRRLKRKRAQHEQDYDCGRVWLDNTTTTRSNIGANSAHNFQKSSPSNDAQRGRRHAKPKQGVDNFLCYSAECLVTHAAVGNGTANCKPCLDDWSAIGVSSVSLKPLLVAGLGIRGAITPVPTQLECTWGCKRARARLDSCTARKSRREGQQHMRMIRCN